MSQAEDIRGVLIQVEGARLLLPNATIAEVLSYAPPEPIENTPNWLLGKIRWRGWQLPLIAFSRLAGISEREFGELGRKMVVLKALGNNRRAPFFAVLTQGFPRLVTVSQEGLETDEDQTGLSATITARVSLNEDAALVPNLERIEAMISQAIKQAAEPAAESEAQA